VVKLATDGEILDPAKVYVARPDWHLLVMPGGTVVVNCVRMAKRAETLSSRHRRTA
jgi:chemotaxis response regulator CheB